MYSAKLLPDLERLRLLDAFLEQTSDGILIVELVDGDGSIVYVNPSFERMMGYRTWHLHGRARLKMLMNKHLNRDTVSAILGAAKMFSPISIDVATTRKDGSPLVVDLSLSPIFGDDGRCTHWVAACRDVTAKQRVVQDVERRRAESAVQEHMRYLSFHDVLTGLPNRSLLLQHVASALMEGRSGAMVSLQLERFDAIAGTLGHKLADELLTHASKRLRGTVRADIPLARLERGTFAAWLPDVREPEPAHELVERMLQSLSDTFTVGGERVALRAHAGIAPAAAHAYNTPEEILRDAELAAHAAAKANVRYRRFSPPLHEHSLTRMRVEFQLHRALERREFVCHFQPIISLADNSIHGFEALARWHDPERGLVLPDIFIPIAEESGHIVRIGELVLEIACREAAQWPRIGGRDLVLNVNVSARQFDDEHFAEKVAKALRDTSLPANRLCLEITETAFATDEFAVLQTLRRLRELGVRIALDDFGVGYSSLAALRRLPFTSVKIDGSFISARSGDETAGIADESIVRMIVALARARNLRIAAEGVESARQFNETRDLGCTHAQGFFIARPMTAEALHAWLENHASFQATWRVV